MPNHDIPEVLVNTRARVAGMREQRATLLDALAKVTLDADRSAHEANRLAMEGDAVAAQAARTALHTARQQRRDLGDRLTRLSRDEALAIEGLAALIDPCDADGDVPLVLLPVRLETRFTSDGSTLRVRIFPDDLHVDRLDEGLSEPERQAGFRYWSEIWAGPPEEEPTAWSALLDAVRPERAPWVAAALTPSNLAERGAGPAPAFPEPPPRLARPPLVRALPDRFVVTVMQGEASSSATGSAIPPELVVGFAGDGDPSGATIHTPSGLALGVGMEWLVDYGEAKAVGMAVDVPLAVPGATVDRVIAVGVRTSLDAAAGARELADLLTSHRYASGAAFLPQGTPTNNTESDPTSWQRRPRPRPPATSVPPAMPPEANAARLAAAFGIDLGVLAGLDNGDLQEEAAAKAANTALWSATWGTFLDRLWVTTPDAASVPDGLRESMRDLWRDHVRGRGTLPTLRLGDQPYGVLPVSAVDRQWLSDGLDPWEAAACALLRAVRPFWRGSVAQVPRVDGEGPLNGTLNEVLASAPQMRGLRVRSVTTETCCSLVCPSLDTEVTENAEAQLQLDELLWMALLDIERGQVSIGATLGGTTRQLGLPLVHESDFDAVTALLAGSRPDVQSVLQALAEIALKADEAAVASAADLGRIGEVTAVVTADLMPPEDRDGLAELLVTAAAGGLSSSEMVLAAERVETVVPMAGVGTLAAIQPVAAVRGSLGEVALQTDLEPTVKARLGLQAIGASFRARARLEEARQALNELARLGEAERAMAVRESLDCASHRFDAWVTSLVARRLDRLRATMPSGAVIGAYGWVEHVRPGVAGVGDGGYVHAPSLAQATTAGILRNAYLTHNPDGTGAGAFAVDLTSGRVRSALGILEGIGAGQPLGALLGYRFERRLHAYGLDRFVLSLRALAPLVADVPTDAWHELPQVSQEAVAANNVVDGVKLLGLRPGLDLENVLSHPPSINPYIPDDPAHWPPPTDLEIQRIGHALDELETVLDALSDLLLAEGVHQLAQGNMARAAAAMDSAAGEGTPLEIDVVRTPQRGVAFTHRLLLALPDGEPPVPGWTMTAPRATAEPRLERWAQARLGRADAIVVGTRPDGTEMTLDQAGLCALDLVYDSGDRSLMEERLVAALPGFDPNVLDDTNGNGSGRRTIAESVEHAASLRRLLAGSRMAAPDAYARPSDAPTRTFVAADVVSVRDRAKSALDHLADTADKLDGALGAAARPGVAGEAGAAAVVVARGTLAGYGITLPRGGAGSGISLGKAALAEALRRIDPATDALDRADTSIATYAEATAQAEAAASPDEEAGLRGAAAAALAEAAHAVAAAGKAIFGEAFWMLPLVARGATPDLFDAGLRVADPGNAQIRQFLIDIATVRERAACHAETLLVADSIGTAPRLRVAQLVPSSTRGAERWIGSPFDPDQPSPTVPVTSVVLDAGTALTGAEPLAGLVLDEWSESVPRRVEVAPPGAVGSREATVTTGVAVGARAPDARAPQAILLAVSPTGGRWTTHLLTETLAETLELATLRMVTLERTQLAARILPAIQVSSWSLQGDQPSIAFANVIDRWSEASVLSFVKD